MPKKAKAPKRAKAEKYEALELQQQRKEPRYKEKYKGLAAELGAQKASLQLETEQQHQAQERQKVRVQCPQWLPVQIFVQMVMTKYAYLRKVPRHPMHMCSTLGKLCW